MHPTHDAMMPHSENAATVTVTVGLGVAGTRTTASTQKGAKLVDRRRSAAAAASAAIAAVAAVAAVAATGRWAVVVLVDLTFPDDPPAGCGEYSVCTPACFLVSLVGVLSSRSSVTVIRIR
jgi:fluoride ion exporter CrcB/FEX